MVTCRGVLKQAGQ